MDSKDVEILVHITAPSKGTDDAVYRAAARSYLNFKPGKRTALFPESGSGGETSSAIVGEERPNSSLPSHSATADQVINTPNLSFRSVLGNPDSPLLKQAAKRASQAANQDTQSSWVAPPSVIQDSIPDNTCALSQFRSPTRILEHYISGFDSSQSEASPILQRKALVGGSSFNNTTPQGSPAPSVGSTQPRAPPTQNLASVIVYPDTQLDVTASSFDAESRRNCDQPASSCFSSFGEPIQTPSQLRHTKAKSQRSTLDSAQEGAVIPASPAVAAKQKPRSSAGSKANVDETRIFSSFPSFDEGLNEASRVRANSEPAAKRARLPSTPSSGKPLVRSSSDIGPGQEQEKAIIRARRKLDHLEIISPPPPTAVQNLEPDDVVTAHLKYMAENFGLKERYRPKFQTRELRPFERGYWLLDCSSWEQSLKDEAWSFLTDHIEQGLVGWGTTCKRDKAFTWIRLYCWGHVVGHMYLLLWAASRRQAKYVGMSWIAGDGKAVVVIEPRPLSR